MLKQLKKILVGGAFKKGLFLVALIVSLFFFFVKFVPSTDALTVVSGSQKPDVKKKVKPVPINNPGDSFVTVDNLFIDPEIEPKFIRHSNSPSLGSKEVPKNELKTETVSVNPDKYPLLHAVPVTTTENLQQTVYLTFDDGPSQVTLKVLDELKARGVKATFFVVGTQVELYPDILKKIVDDGHAIGIHTDTHDYEKIYQSLDTFLVDYNDCYEKIRQVTDYPVTVTRFPGGSNSMYNAKVRAPICDELNQRGFTYFDWNVSSGDAAAGGITSERYIQNILNGIKDKNRAVILMHDAFGRTVTSESIGIVIDELTKMGYRFDVLSNKVQPIQF